MTGLYLVLLGALIFAAPLWDIFRKFGEVSEETIIKWIAGMTIQQRVNLSVSFTVAIAMIRFGFFLMARPQWR